VRVALRLAVYAAVLALLPATPLCAQTRAVSGQAGILGEWELTATVTQQDGSGGSLWTGALSLKHVGFCSVDGPEEKTGTLQLRVSDPPGEVVATLLIEGVECAFKGHGTDGYDGVMTCPGRRDEPMMLILQ
jgi:hypothetical protein